MGTRVLPPVRDLSLDGAAAWLGSRLKVIRVAGCDAFTAPCDVLRAFISQTDRTLDRTLEPLPSQLERSYEDRLGVDDNAAQTVGADRIARLWRIEPEFVEFLLDYRTSAEYRALRDGEQLRRRFESAGFGDFFYGPDVREWQILKKGKLPDLAAPLVTRLAVDTHMSLLADADFVTSRRRSMPSSGAP